MNPEVYIEREPTNAYPEDAFEVVSEPVGISCESKLAFTALCASCPLIAMFGECPKGIRENTSYGAPDTNFELQSTDLNTNSITQYDILINPLNEDAFATETPPLQREKPLTVATEVEKTPVESSYPESKKETDFSTENTTPVSIQPEKTGPTEPRRSYKELLFDDSISVVLAPQFLRRKRLSKQLVEPIEAVEPLKSIEPTATKLANSTTPLLDTTPEKQLVDEPESLSVVLSDTFVDTVEQLEVIPPMKASERLVISENESTPIVSKSTEAPIEQIETDSCEVIADYVIEKAIEAPVYLPIINKIIPTTPHIFKKTLTSIPSSPLLNYSKISTVATPPPATGSLETEHIDVETYPTQHIAPEYVPKEYSPEQKHAFVAVEVIPATIPPEQSFYENQPDTIDPTVALLTYELEEDSTPYAQIIEVTDKLPTDTSITPPTKPVFGTLELLTMPIPVPVSKQEGVLSVLFGAIALLLSTKFSAIHP